MTRLLSALLMLGALLVPLGVSRADPAEDALRQRLRETKLNLAVDDQRFADVVKLLRIQTETNILVDPRIEMDIADIPVAGLFVEDIPFETVLDLLATSGGEDIVWIPNGNTIVFTHRAFLRELLEVRIYPLGALVAPRTEFVPPVSSLVGRPESEEEHREPYPFGTMDDLIELLKSGVEPSFWEETEGADMRSMGERRLVVRASARIHAAIVDFLAHLESLSVDALLVEVHAVQPTTAPDRGASMLADDEVARLLATTQPGPSLRCAVRDGRQSTVFAGQRRAHVAAYDALLAGKRTYLDPRIETREIGMGARIRAVAGAGGRRILLKLDVAVAEWSQQGETEILQDDLLSPTGRSLVRRDGVLLVTPGAWHWAEGSTGGTQDAGWGFLVRATPVPAPAQRERRAPAFSIPEPELRLPAEHPLARVRIERIEWEDADLDQVVGTLKAATGLNFFITPRVRAEFFEEVRLHLQLADVSARTVLDLTTAPFELEWRFEGNLVTIDTRRAPDRPLPIRYFDVRFLVEDILPAHVGPASDNSFHAAPIHRAEELVELIRETVGRYEDWEDPASIELRNGIIIARNQAHVLDATERLLGGLRDSLTLVVTTVDQIRVSGDTARQLLGDGSGRYPLLLESASATAIEKALAEGRAERIGSERLVSLEGSGTPKVSGSEVTYVADYDISVSREAGTALPVPVVKTLHTGTLLEVRALATYPGNAVDLEIVAERTELASMEKVETRHGPIELPLTKVWRVSTGLRVPAGKTAVLFASGDADGWHVFLVTATRIPLERK